MDGIRHRLDELILREYRKVQPGSICLVAISPEGSAVSLTDLEPWLIKFQKTVYQVGRRILEERYHQAPQKRSRTDQRLRLTLEPLRKSGAYGIRMGIGREQLPLEDLTTFQADVLKRIEEMYDGNDALSVKKTLKPDRNVIGELAVFWRGGGVRVQSG